MVVDPELTASDNSPLDASPDISAVDVAIEPEGTEQSFDPVNQLQPASSQLDQVAAPSDPPATPSSGQTVELEEPSLAAAAMPLTIVRKASPSKQRRRSTFSVLSVTLQSMRRKKLGGYQRSHARTMARFVRQARTIRAPPVFTIDLHHLASLEFAKSDEDSDDEWNDEEVVRIVV